MLLMRENQREDFELHLRISDTQDLMSETVSRD
jgi:hypothetical protein